MPQVLYFGQDFGFLYQGREYLVDVAALVSSANNSLQEDYTSRALIALPHPSNEVLAVSIQELSSRLFSPRKIRVFDDLRPANESEVEPWKIRMGMHALARIKGSYDAD